ncbi:Crinkler (CRN) family protein [Phytophthora cinnamomi]|uniref:Crinkler (CRN) family protein n=1 Tax=Phytophthora cinnamomi TaxID=4785 RepID=UPI00355993F5|nr:Crinkler (CRN) family protein [Phytophthora cinnamomi]
MAAVEPKTLTDFKNLAVNEDEFRLDSLSTTRQVDSPIAMTPTLHEFWEGFPSRNFPPYYFARMEEVVFWKVIKNLLFDKDRVVIVGSPGVGKSCLLMLIAFYLACIEKKKVLVIRRLNQRKHMNAVAFLDGGGSYARLLDFSPNDILAIRRQAQVESAIVLVDGFTQGEVEDAKNGYMPFDVLATSCQFDAKQDDNSHIVVLAGWFEADLLRYAKLTNWVIETGLHEASCYACLSTLGKDTYWYPDFPFFPLIDAVTTCEAFRRGSEGSETIVAYIQMTIRSEKKFKEASVHRLNEEKDKNQSLKDMKDPNTFLAVVSCFSSEQLEPRCLSVNF